MSTRYPSNYKMAVLSLLVVIAAGVALTALFALHGVRTVPTTMVVEAAEVPKSTEPNPANFTDMGRPFNYKTPQAGADMGGMMMMPEGTY